MENYEKLGAFYLGRTVDPEKKETSDNLLLYDSKDLTTHAVCVGMTGSGKTGLCISLIEEAAIDGIPVIIIDPKGDMANLLLSFPDFTAEEFKPWADASEAAIKDLSLVDYAQKQANLWQTGLKKWGQTGERVRRFKDAADISVYTPGSTSGIPISILKSFAAPPEKIRDDSDLLNERISTAVTSLLALLGIEADPIKSREHILLSSILNHFWQKGEDLELSKLIQAIQSPPISRVGVFNIESFYPSKERFELAMTLNNLLAAPAFQSWIEGEPMDIDQLIYTKTSKPRIPIFYIAHLSDTERMFFVSMLLNQILGWMRTQSGTSSLRAILYIDEIFGYIPPIGNPPSKKPLLTLLKQARAFGLGVVLATQNPVDLDYKGLSNTGTWFIGRLQTEQDRDRVLDGLESASGSSKNGFNKQKMEKIVSGLGKRRFLLHNVHERQPELFETRWAMSYLCGPLTRSQIKKLMAAKKHNQPEAASQSKRIKPTGTTKSVLPPTLAPNVSQLYLPIQNKNLDRAELIYQPCLWASAKIQFTDKRKKIDFKKSIKLITPITSGVIAVDWEKATITTLNESELLKSPEKKVSYADVPATAIKAANYKLWEKNFKDYLLIFYQQGEQIYYFSILITC